MVLLQFFLMILVKSTFQTFKTSSDKLRRSIRRMSGSKNQETKPYFLPTTSKEETELKTISKLCQEIDQNVFHDVKLDEYEDDF